MQIFSNGEDIGCFSHTLSHCGEQVDLACVYLHDFMNLVSGTFSRSSNAKSSLEAYCPGASTLDYSKTRWFARRDALKWLMLNFHVVTEWYRFSTDDFEADERTQYRKLRKILLIEVAGHDADRLFWTKFEMAISVDVTRLYHEACYNLEGDGALAMVAYDQVETVYDNLMTNMDSMSYPNLQSLIREKCETIHDPVQKENKRSELVAYARDKMLQGYTYFMTHFWETNAKRYKNLQLFKIYRILNPKFVKSLGDNFTTAYVENHLRQLIQNERWQHILNNQQLLRIIDQTSEYKRLCRNEDDENLDYKDSLKRIVAFWKTHRDALSAWWVLVEPAYLTQPSSCAAERALSVFTRCMTDNMKNALIDVIEGSMMLAINTDDDDC